MPYRYRTSAVQAYGAGNHAALGPIFKRTLLFLWAHCLPISGLLLGAPSLLQLLSGDQELAAMAHRCVCVLRSACVSKACGPQGVWEPAERGPGAGGHGAEVRLCVKGRVC